VDGGGEGIVPDKLGCDCREVVAVRKGADAVVGMKAMEDN